MSLFSFQGRVGRQQFWLTSLALIAVVVVLEFLVRGARGSPVALMFLVLMVPLVWISLAVGIKRWHDRDKSGWWILINLLPFIGGIWALVENGFLKGTSGQNRFGADPVG
jgi:uncharacterized membrane protein YhaH (DUF805 family)